MAEGIEIGTAYLSIVPSAAGFGAKLQSQVNGEAATAGTAAGKALGGGMLSGVSTAAKGIAGIFAVVGATRFLHGAVSEAEEAVRVGNLTAAVIRSTGAAAGVSAAQVSDLATSLSKVAGVDDEVIQSAENVLLTFTQVSGQVFPEATRAALDMSAALGGDLQDSVIQLGKALNDPVQGMSALRRVGISFTEGQVAQVKALQATGDLLGAQKIILAEVNKEFGGAAAANATALDHFHVSVANLEEAVGAALLPVLNVLADGLTSLFDGFTALPAPVRAVTVGLAGLAAAAGVFAFLVPKVRAASLEVRTMGSSFTGLVGAINPWTVALTGAVLLFGTWSAAKAKAKRLAQEFTDTLNTETGAITDNTKALLAQKLATPDMASALEVLGLGYDDLGAAILGTKREAADFEAKVLEQASGGDSRAEFAMRNRISTVLDALHRNRTALDSSTQASERSRAAAKALGVGMGGLAGKVDGAAGAVVDLTDAQKAMESVMTSSLSLTGTWADGLTKLNDDAAKAARESADQVRTAADDRLAALRDAFDKERDAVKARQGTEGAHVFGVAAQAALKARQDAELQALEDRATAETKAAEKTVEAEHKRADAIEAAAKKTGLSVAQTKAAAQQRLADAKALFTDLAVVAARGGGAIVDDLQALGPDAAGMIHELAGLSKPGFDDFVKVVDAGSADAVTAMRQQFEAVPAELQKIGEAGGQKLRDGVLAGLAAHKLTVEDITAVLFSVQAGPVSLLPGQGEGPRNFVGLPVTTAPRPGEPGFIGPDPNFDTRRRGQTIIENLNVQTVQNASPQELADAVGSKLAWRLP